MHTCKCLVEYSAYRYSCVCIYRNYITDFESLNSIIKAFANFKTIFILKIQGLINFILFSSLSSCETLQLSILILNSCIMNA